MLKYLEKGTAHEEKIFKMYIKDQKVKWSRNMLYFDKKTKKIKCEVKTLKSLEILLYIKHIKKKSVIPQI